MTLVNRLIKEARSNPECLKINAGQVRQIAAHCHSLNNPYGGPKMTVEEIEHCILAGRLRMAGIPLKVA